VDVNKLAEMIEHAVPYPAEHYAEQLLEAIRHALQSAAPTTPCDVRVDEWGNRHDRLAYGGVVYACAVRARAPDYSRRALLVPGAVIALVHDGAETRCHVHRVATVEDAIKALEVAHASSLYVWPGGAQPDVWRFICLR
jgi:hypothetical protein